MKKKILIAGIVVVLMVVFYIIGKVAPPASKDNSDSSSPQIQSSLNSTSKEESSSSESSVAEESNSQPQKDVPIIAGSNAYDMTVSLEEYKFPTATRTDISDGFQFDSMNSDYSYTIVTDKDYAISYAKCMALGDNSDLLAFFATFPYDTMDQETAQQWVKDNTGNEATTQIGDAIYTLSNGNQGAILEISAIGREEYLKEQYSTSDSSQNVQNANFGWDSSTSSTETGSSARVDEILSKATDDAKNTPGDAGSQCEEALSYLKEHAENFYENNEIMEKSMYYGCFIYSYIENSTEAKDVSELNNEDRTKYDAGYNTVKAIKYVYRGAEKIEDKSTQNALKETQDALNKIN